MNRTKNQLKKKTTESLGMPNKTKPKNSVRPIQQSRKQVSYIMWTQFSQEL